MRFSKSRHVTALATFALAAFTGGSITHAAPDAKIAQASVASTGDAQGVRAGDNIRLFNPTLEAAWSFAGGKLKPVAFTETALGLKHDLSNTEAFRVGVTGVEGLAKPQGFVPTNLVASDFVLAGEPTLVRLVANPKAVRLAERLGGWRVGARLKHAASGLDVEWSAELRDGASHVRQVLRLTGEKGALAGVQVVDFEADGARQIGTATAGNPVATDSLFLGLELPMGKNEISGSRVKTGIACDLPLEKGVIYEFGSVVGVYAKNQLRRSFLAYLEQERAAPARQFLHYNGWFDFDRSVNEKGMLETIAAYDQELIKKRGVPVKSFVIDDGWDDWDSGFWAINTKKFPSGFTRVGEALTKIDSRFGIWISPLAGYQHADQRIALAAKAGLVREGSKALDLSYAPYYKWFLEKCTALIRDDKNAYFKFDKAGSGVSPHFLALLRICRELRLVDPQLVVNITVGTWPSPFWLNHIDCTWRGGTDMGGEGPGDDRERWITYRDAQTWRGVVSQAPLYPLNSIMTHGIVLSDGHPLARTALKAGKNMKHEARSFFGSGTTMQELYVKPAITTPEAWDQIAEAAKWSRANADILVDTHWIGGNPSNGANVYGWAAWTPRKGVITLRNPSDKPAEFVLDVSTAFELPENAPRKFSVKGAYADAPAPFAAIEAGKPVTIPLKPFEVLVLEFTPKK